MSKKLSIIEKKNPRNATAKLRETSSSILGDEDPSQLVSLLEQTIVEQKKTIKQQKKTIKQQRKTFEKQTRKVKNKYQQKEKTQGSQSKRIEKLLLEIMELKEKLNRYESAKNNNSVNSSIPPSASNPAGSTGNHKPKKIVNRNTSLRKNKQNHRGAPKNHKGGGMKLKGTSDCVIDIFADKCKKCPLFETCKAQAKIKDTRYTQDVEIRTIQTEYHIWSIPCSQDKEEFAQGQFPAGITGSKQYGKNIKMLMVALRNYGIVSYSRLVELGKYFGFKFSTSTILNFCRKFADTCISAKELIRKVLQNGSVIGVDETGGNVNGEKCWHHSAVNKRATFITSFPKRGKDGTDNAGIIGDFNGTIVHDFWRPYFQFKNVLHAMCAAHLERENNKASEDNPKIYWPDKMTDVFHEMQTARREAIEKGLQSIPDEILTPLMTRYEQTIRDGKEEDPVRPNPKCKKNGEPRKPVLTKAQNLLKRYELYQNDILRFTVDFEVPITNNCCERSMRQMKIAYKVFGCFRTKRGSDDYSSVRSILDTGRKQGYGPQEIIDCIMSGDFLGIFSNKDRHYLMQL